MVLLAIERHAEKDDWLVLIIGLQGFQCWNLFDTWPAPGGPEINIDQFAASLLPTPCATVNMLERQRWSRAAFQHPFKMRISFTNLPVQRQIPPQITGKSIVQGSSEIGTKRKCVIFLQQTSRELRT